MPIEEIVDLKKVNTRFYLANDFVSREAVISYSGFNVWIATKELKLNFLGEICVDVAGVKFFYLGYNCLALN